MLDPGSGDVTYKVMRDSDARRQVKSNWCGPATMQMIDGGDPKDTNGFDSQASWANDLGTRSSGTSITSMVRQINGKTSWDDRAGKYAVVSVTGWSADRFWRAITRQIGYYGAPHVQHPKLLKRFHPYLAGDHGGHFQVGRGYTRTSDGRRFLHLLAPYNEPDWNGNYTNNTWGPRRIGLVNALDANKANVGHKNIGI